MRDMEFVGVSEDGSSVVLRSPWGEDFRVDIDDRLQSAVRTDRSRVGSIDPSLEASIRPAEIQARLRAGETAEDIAEDAGMPIERVRRYELPILAERAFVAEQARDTVVRRENDETLGALVVRRLSERGESPSELSWDSYRREDARWQIVATTSTTTASFAFEPSGRTIIAADDAGRLLLNVETPRLVTVDERDDVDQLIDWVSDNAAPERRDTVPIARRPIAVVPDPEPEPVEPEPVVAEVIIDVEPPTAPTPAKGRSRRASVPSWDEILFGTQPTE